MIGDSQLMKISFTATIIGIIALYGILYFSEPCRLKISEISESDAGKKIITQGIITKFSEKNGNVFMTVYDGKEISLVVFSKNADEDIRALGPGGNITIDGKVAIYNGGIEIIAEKIELIK
jgi:aspartyl/asparaginyl-tRNA synthetase